MYIRSRLGRENGPGASESEWTLWCYKPEIMGPLSSAKQSMDMNSPIALYWKLAAGQEKKTGDLASITTAEGSETSGP